MPTTKKRVWVTFESGAYKEVVKYAKESGMKPSVYINMGAIIGCRMLARVASPEKFLTPDMLEALIKLQKDDGA